MAVQHKYAGYVGIFHRADAFFPLALSPRVSVFPSPSVTVDFAITMALRKCGRLMQQQQTTLKLLAAIIQHIFIKLCCAPSVFVFG